MTDRQVAQAEARLREEIAKLCARPRPRSTRWRISATSGRASARVVQERREEQDGEELFRLPAHAMVTP